MLSEKDNATLRDMLHHIELAERFVQGRSFESLRDEVMPLYAVTRCLEIISEASRRLSGEFEGSAFPDAMARDGCGRKLLSA